MRVKQKTPKVKKKEVAYQVSSRDCDKVYIYIYTDLFDPVLRLLLNKFPTGYIYIHWRDQENSEDWCVQAQISCN